MPESTTTKKRTIPFEIRHSAIQGLGAFATRPIRKGRRIIEYLGERITQAEADARYDDAAMARHHTFLFNLDEDAVLDGGVNGNEARFINHSCEPNCQAFIEEDRIFIYARRDIALGEELSYDYGYERTEGMTEEDEARYVCRCGTKACRGTILAPPKPAEEPAAPAKKEVARASKSKSQAKRPGTRKGTRAAQRTGTSGRGGKRASRR